MNGSRLSAVLPVLLFCPAPALAHPGHSADPDHGILHALSGIEHGLPMLLTVVAALILSAVIRNFTR